MAPASLSNIPRELLLYHIFPRISHREDLACFALTSRQFHNETIPVLYQSVLVNDFLVQTAVDQPSSNVLSKYAQYVEDVGFLPDTFYRVFPSELDLFRAIARDVIPLLTEIRTFRWPFNTNWDENWDEDGDTEDDDDDAHPWPNKLREHDDIIWLALDANCPKLQRVYLDDNNNRHAKSTVHLLHLPSVYSNRLPRFTR